ncbi:MAG TPA: allophanate hydrolase, partial [Candidatus Dormibacteraeota bacterium]|nr:allophanate hydrolase [Candidatus Dormibacteraeota bacterium]
AVQVTGDGTAILLGPDRGTTGGYAVPAVVAAVDVPRLGRLRPGAPVRFRRVDVDAAEALRAERATVVRRAAGSLRGVA